MPAHTAGDVFAQLVNEVYGPASVVSPIRSRPSRSRHYENCHSNIGSRKSPRLFSRPPKYRKTLHPFAEMDFV